MNNPFEQTRITQLVSDYSPDSPPRLPLDFGDYLSLLWRLDRHVEQPARVVYYRRCAQSLGAALGIKNRSIYKLVETTPPGEVYRQLPNAPYRGTSRLIDAQDRKAAIAQLVQLRDDVLRIGARPEEWTGARWPGSGITDVELRERVFAVLFTALQGQFGNFGRILLVIDIVLANLLIGFEPTGEIPLQQLIASYNYPNPAERAVREAFYGDF